MPSRPAVVVFDLGGVVIDVDFARVLARWARLTGAEPARLRERFSHDDGFRRHERGELDDDGFRRHLERTLGIALSPAQFAEGWNAIFGGLQPGIVDVLDALKPRVRLACFTNTNTLHEVRWRELYGDAMERFERVFCSHRIGRRKPEPEAYVHVARELGVEPGRILFFDDGQAQVDGARAAGWEAERVASVADIRAALAARSLA